MKTQEQVLITGWGLAAPGAHSLQSLLQTSSEALRIWPHDPERKLGKKGLRFKDAATKLALCAAHDAMQHARLPVAAGEQIEPERFGAVVSSNFGNLDTVCRAVSTIREQNVDQTSAMDLPNASSNVVATSLAIRFGLQALNLMLCNGSTSGADAIYLASAAIRSGRASRMLVVGVEVHNEFVERLFLGDSSAAPINIAGALVLESDSAARARNAPVLAVVSKHLFSADERHKRASDDFRVEPHVPTLRSTVPQRPASIASGDEMISAGPVARTYGAAGVLQAILLVDQLASAPQKRAVAATGADYGDLAGVSLLLEAAR